MQHLSQEMTSIRLFDLRHALRGACRYRASSSVATIWPEINDIVGGFDDIKIVLDDEHGVATIHQAGQDLEQTLDIGEVQTCCRFIQNVHGTSGAAPAQLTTELD